MFVKRFLCFDLKTGITAFGILNMIYSSFAAIAHLTLAVLAEDAEDGTDNTIKLAGSSVNIAVMATLFYGAKNEKRILLLPFLIMGCLLLGLVTVVIVIYVFIIPLLVVLCLPLVFFWYVWLAVLSLYQILDPRNPNYVPSQIPETAVYVENHPPQVYYENKLADAV